jgi:hypothetical protein
MRTVRSVCDWKGGHGLIQRVDDNIFVSDDKKFVVKNPADVSEFFSRRNLNRESLLSRCVYRFGFKRGEHGYNGFCFACEMDEDFIKQSKIDANPHDSFREFTDVDGGGLIELSIGGDYREFDDDALLYLKLCAENKGCIIVSKNLHEYIVGNTGADRVLIGKRPVIYAREDEYVGCLAPQFMTFNEEGKSIAPGLWFESLHKRE